MEIQGASTSTMAPQDDLFIEPPNADDYDTLYGDYNDTMSDPYQSHIGRPYIRLNSILPNITKDAGATIKLRCDAIGSPTPIRFEWFKNHAPLERRKNQITIRTRDFWSRVKISELRVLDSGYYMCKASNAAGSVNTTSIVKVRPSSRRLPDDSIFDSIHDGATSSRNIIDSPRGNNNDNFDHQSQLSHKNSGGWKDWEIGRNRPHTLPVGTCIKYEGQVCEEFLHGQNFVVTSSNPEDLLDIERSLRAAMMFISNHSEISPECKRISHQTACLHRFHICDPNPQLSSGAHSDDLPPTLQLCKDHCDQIQNVQCSYGYKLAEKHGLIGKGKLLNDCAELPVTNRCLPVLESLDSPIDKVEDESHWCFVGAGRSYRGTLANTETGRQCLQWNSGVAVSKGYSPAQFPGDLTGAANYCRNPGGHRTRPWCFGPDGKEEYCDLKPCPPGMFPILRKLEKSQLPDPKLTDRRPTGNRNSDGGMSLSELWSNLAPQWQYAVIGGASAFLLLLLILIICIYCKCCKRKSRNHSGKPHMHGSTLLTSNGVYPGNVHSGSTYLGPKINGTPMSAHHGAAAYELTSLLPPPPSRSPPPPAYNYGGNYGGGSTAPSSEFMPPDIHQNHLKYDDYPMGNGVYGKVWEGELLGCTNSQEEPMKVIIKTLREDATPRLRQDFENEMKTLSRLRHPNIVEMIGACMSSTPFSIIFEYMINGTLHDFLKVRSPYSKLINGNVDKDRMLLDHPDFLHIATQIASGMEYLSSVGYVHRDLGSRNCLMTTERLTVKISDFGVIRDKCKSDYFKMQNNVIPVRWMPPESIFQNKYSEESDVWAFGVTLWEIYSYGSQPYSGNRDEEVIDMIRNRFLLQNPLSCPSRLYSVMVECWHEVSSRRPRFSELHGRLQTWSVMSSPAQSTALGGVPPRSGSVHSGTSVGRVSRQSSSQHSAANWHSTPMQNMNNNAIIKQHNNPYHMSPAQNKTNNAYNNSFEVESTTSGD